MSYPELAELLRPFSAIGEMPAPPRLRILACAVNLVILSVPVTLWKGLRPTSRSTDRAWSPWVAWSWLANLVYFFALEAWWGASLGKRLFGLQLASPGGTGLITRIARRTAIFHIPWLVFSSLVLSVGPIGPVTDRQIGPNSTLKASDTRSLIQSSMTMTLVAALFFSARRRNGWAGLHELASGTRVVARSSARVRSRRAAPAAPPLDAAPSPRASRYGPFVVATDSGNDDPQLVVGFDPVLRRQVWIHLARPHTRLIDTIRRDLARPGRLHWLTGLRSGSDNWDAFEAPDGHALLAALHDGVPAWSTLKSWLLDLSGELVAAAADRSMPALRLDRLWVRDDGRLVLLDFQAPGVGRDETPGTSADLSPVQLLSAVAERSIPASNRSEALMPLSAGTMLRSWSRQNRPARSRAARLAARDAGGAAPRGRAFTRSVSARAPSPSAPLPRGCAVVRWS